MSEQDLKLIENHIKDLLFNKNASAASQPPPIPSNPDLNYNRSPYLYSDKSFLPNKEDSDHKKHVSFEALDGSLNKQPSSSQLIDLNVLTDFAAKHAGINNDMISNSSRVLPHPELENDLLATPGTNIAKDISLNCNTLQESNNPSKFPSFSENLPSEDLKLCDRERNSIGPDQPSNTEYYTSCDKKKKGKKSRKQIAKEKANRKTVGRIDEKPINQLLPSSKEAPKPEINSINKHSSPRKAAPRMSEKKETFSHDMVADQCPRTPLPIQEKEYALNLLNDACKFECHICNYECQTKDSINKHINSDVHREIKKQIQTDKVLPFLPNPLPYQVEALTDLLNQFHAEEGLQAEDMVLRDKLATRMREFLMDNIPDCSLEMVGSSVTGLGLKKSRVDFGLKVAQTQDIPDSLELLYKKLLSDSTFCNVKSEFKKKKLGILFTDKGTGLNCTIVLENVISEKYARLFSAYSEIDPRVKILASCFRHWAELCLLDDQDRGTLPSVTFRIMLVYFLQQIEPPVLPVLNEQKEYGYADLYENYIKKGFWKSGNDCSVGELWLKLFHFYNFTYEIGKHVVCLRSSEKVLCSEKNWSTKFYAIEDPFSRRNIGHVIPSFSVCHYIQQCFRKTYRYFAFPQITNEEIKLVKNDEFESFLMSYTFGKSEMRDDSSDESTPSDNEDSSIPDEASFLQDLEDHDPDIPIDSVLITLKNMHVNDKKSNLDEEEEATHEQNFHFAAIKPSSSQQSSVKADSPKKEIKKNKDKSKTEEKIHVRGTIQWDLGDLQITKESFNYCFDPVLFKDRKDVPFSCKLCKSSSHLKKDCPSENRLPRPTLPAMTPEFLRVINKTLHYIRDKNCVDDADKSFMLNNMQEIELYIKKQIPEASLSMFGSFCNGFGFKNRSDMDFCLTFKGRTDSKDLDSTEVIENLAKHLCKFSKLENILPVTSAKVPIVKFACTETGLEGDISLYNRLALVNTEMLEMYSKIDPRVQILGFALKYFAKVLGICDASRGSLSSYAYILMVIFFLQQRQPPVIPVLQELHGEEKPTHMVDEWNVWFFKDFDKLPEIWPDYGKNEESPAELWIGLLSFYAYDFDWREHVVSIRQKALLTRFRKLWITDQIAIEDPFDLSHNLGAGLSRKMNMYILQTFARGWERFGTSLSVDCIMQIQGHEVIYLFDRRFLNSGVEPPHDRGCRTCGKIGHIAKNCTQEKVCSFCRKTGHYHRNCPRKKQKMKNKPDRNTQENFSFENKSNIEPQNLVGHSLRVQGVDMKRVNNLALNHLPQNTEESTRKFLQMGFPLHRHPPPGFPKNFKGPPPGFKAIHPNSTKYNRFPHHCPAPFPRSMPGNNLSHSPPKHFSSSPPKHFAGSSIYHTEPVSPMGIRTGLLPDPHMPPSDPLIHRIWQKSLPNRMTPQYMDRRKRTN